MTTRDLYGINLPVNLQFRGVDGRFISNKASGGSVAMRQRIFKSAGMRVARLAAANLRDQTSSGSRRFHKQKYIGDGRMARAYSNPSNVRVNATGFTFMVKPFLDSSVPYWAAVEYGTRRHIGRKIYFRSGRIVASAPGNSLRDGAPRIKRPIQRHGAASEAWQYVVAIDKQRWGKSIMKELYPDLHR